MVFDEEQLLLHLADLKKLYASRANISFCAGVLTGALLQVKIALAKDSSFDRARASQAVQDALDFVLPILNKEFYPEAKIPPKTAAGPANPANPPPPDPDPPPS